MVRVGRICTAAALGSAARTHLQHAGDELAQATVEHRVTEDRGNEGFCGPLSRDKHQHAVT